MYIGIVFAILRLLRYNYKTYYDFSLKTFVSDIALGILIYKIFTGALFFFCMYITLCGPIFTYEILRPMHEHFKYIIDKEFYERVPRCKDLAYKCTASIPSSTLEANNITGASTSASPTAGTINFTSQLTPVGNANPATGTDHTGVGGDLRAGWPYPLRVFNPLRQTSYNSLYYTNSNGDYILDSHGNRITKAGPIGNQPLLSEFAKSFEYQNNKWKVKWSTLTMSNSYLTQKDEAFVLAFLKEQHPDIYDKIWYGRYTVPMWRRIHLSKKFINAFNEGK